MIEKNLLSKIEEFNFWYKEQDVGIQRGELAYLLRFAEDKDFCLVITGIRRAGKTYLAKQLLKKKIDGGIKREQTLYINFEDPSLEPYLNTESLTAIYSAYRYFLNKDEMAYIVLDEVYNVKNWEKWVRVMLDKKENVKIIITGSSSKLSKGELATLLTGREVTVPIFPLDFTAFLKFRKHEIKKYESYHSLSFLLNEYLEYGGFPLIVLAEKDKKTIYLKELFDDILTKDIIIRYKLRETEIKKLAVVLLNNFSSPVSVTKLSNLMETVARIKLSPSTINDYLHYFEETFLFFFVPIFSYKVKDVMQYPRKAYCIDAGLINAISLRFSENLGKLYENTVAINLIRRHGKENLFYWKDKSGNEVDFVVKDHLSVRLLIQVCHDIRQPKVRKRELAALLKASEELKCANLFVITEDIEGEEEISGKKVKFLPLWKWLITT
ncbi:MAG: ATP-binding protein [Candidatus Bilamarchaeaceae archaeon]